MSFAGFNNVSLYTLCTHLQSTTVYIYSLIKFHCGFCNSCAFQTSSGRNFDTQKQSLMTCLQNKGNR